MYVECVYHMDVAFKWMVVHTCSNGMYRVLCIHDGYMALSLFALRRSTESVVDGLVDG